MKRTIAAFLIAPIIPAAVLTQGAVDVVVVGFSYAFSYLLGVPVFLVLKKKKKESHLLYGASGFVVGALYVFVPAIFVVRRLDSSALQAAVIFAMIGALVALCFSLIRGDERNRADSAAPAQRR